ncbi:MAG TPA: ATP-binding protein [Candidatus Sulfotelmatobacter sp.]|nr:ATP-binding protein [Candidatus Sulfotelmatobacter sp.]
MADTVRQRVAAAIALAFLLLGVGAWAAAPHGGTGGPGALDRQPDDTVLLVWFGAAILLLGAWWLTRPGRPAIVARLGWPLLAASIAPFSLAILATFDPSWSIPAVGLLWPLSVAPLAEALTTYAPDARRRRVAIAAALACYAVAVVIGPQMASVGMAVPVNLGDGASTAAAVPTFTVSPEGSALRAQVVAGITVLPALLAGFLPRRVAGMGWAIGRDQLIEGVTLAAIGLTPVVAGLVLNLTDPLLAMAALVVWAVIVAAAARLAIRPLDELTRRATLQRDLTVTLAEAQRVRLAADLHDGPLQDLTLLVRRLDASGDAEGAALARSIAAELRDVTGELRLPILDHLGAGVAMEWLVERVQRLSGNRIELVRDDVARPPAEVELALFRVAQEALANAVRHGRPPIRVAYRADAGFASLSVEDAGPGIELASTARAVEAGRFGLLGMQQRAEQVGARLDLHRRPEGGTEVSLEWHRGALGWGVR